MKLISLSRYSKKALTIYGKYTLDNRAIPDFRDGLKPVHRRILYSAFQLGLSDHKGLLKKSARLVGDVLGKYHPHGDMAVYSSIVGMVHSLNPSILGSGNWGTLIDSPAAMRYTECRLTSYSDKVFFNTDYKTCINYVSNFDGSEKEPIILPSLLPNLLLNGAFGIATGGRCSIPAFETKGVLNLVKIALKRNVKVGDCLKHLVPKCPEGGQPWLKGDSLKGLKKFYETGEGSLYWLPEVEEDIPNKSVRIIGFAPSTSSSLSTIIKKIANNDKVADIVDESDIKDNETQLKYLVTLKRSIAKDDVEETLGKIITNFESNQSLVFAITERNQKNDEIDIKFSYTNMPDFFTKWVEWRLAIEKESLIFKLDKERNIKNYNELLLWACKNKQKIIKALDTDDPIKKLISYGLTEDNAKALLELKIKQLQKLEMYNIVTNIKNSVIIIKDLKLKLKDTAATIISQLDEVKI